MKLVLGVGSLVVAGLASRDLGDQGNPLDLAFARGGRYLYVLDRGHTRIAGYAVDRDGVLQPLTAAAGDLPAFASGLAAD